MIKIFFLSFILQCYLNVVFVETTKNAPIISRRLFSKTPSFPLYKKNTLFDSLNKDIQKQNSISPFLRTEPRVIISSPVNPNSKLRILKVAHKEQMTSHHEKHQDLKHYYPAKVDDKRHHRHLENEVNSQNTELVENHKPDTIDTSHHKVYSDGQVQTMEYPNKSLQEMIDYSIDQSKNSNNIVIINHRSVEDMEKPVEKPVPTENEPAKPEVNPIYLAPEKSTLNSLLEVSVNDIPTLLSIIKNIENLYSAFYKNMPEEPRGTEHEVATADLKEYIKRLQIFTKDIIQNSDSLMSDINYLENKINAMKQGDEAMMDFYNLERKYAILKIQVEVALDPEVHKLWNHIRTYTQEFDLYEKNLKRYAYDLYKFNKYFAAQIRSINQDNNTDGLQNSVEQFDKVLMLSVRLIELKVDLEKCLEGLKIDFNNLQELGVDINNTIAMLGGKIETEIARIEREKILKEKGIVPVAESIGLLNVFALLLLI